MRHPIVVDFRLAVAGTVCMAVLTGLPWQARAQDPDRQQEFKSNSIKRLIQEYNPVQNTGDEPPVGEIRRDPFSATGKIMNQKIKPALKRTLTDLGFDPQHQPDAIPRMRLKGQIQGAEGEVVALLEIEDGHVYIVREGDTVGLHEFGYNAVIRVQKIDRLHLVIESGSLGQLIIVR